jgi:hypothetical protein
VVSSLLVRTLQGQLTRPSSAAHGVKLRCTPETKGLSTWRSLSSAGARAHAPLIRASDQYHAVKLDDGANWRSGAPGTAAYPSLHRQYRGPGNPPR